MFIQIDFGTRMAIAAVTDVETTEHGLVVTGRIGTEDIQGYSVHPDLQEDVLNALGMIKDDDGMLCCAPVRHVSDKLAIEALADLLDCWVTAFEGFYISYGGEDTQRTEVRLDRLCELEKETAQMLGYFDDDAEEML